MSTFSGIYLNYEGTTSQCNSQQQPRELVYDTTSGLMRYKTEGGDYLYLDSYDPDFTGTENYLAKFGIGNTLENSILNQSGTTRIEIPSEATIAFWDESSSGPYDTATINGYSLDITDITARNLNLNLYGIDQDSLTLTNTQDNNVDNLNIYTRYKLTDGVQNSYEASNTKIKQETRWYDGTVAKRNARYDIDVVCTGVLDNRIGLSSLEGSYFYLPSYTGDTSFYFRLQDETDLLNINKNGNVTISSIESASSDTDKFLVSDSGIVKYRTGVEVLSDIGGTASTSISGTENYIAKFGATGATVGDSHITDTASQITVNVASGDINTVFNGTSANLMVLDAGDMTVSLGGNIVFSPLVGVIRQSTDDGSDIGSTTISGGGDFSDPSRGASITVFGNDASGVLSGDVHIECGDNNGDCIVNIGTDDDNSAFEINGPSESLAVILGNKEAIFFGNVTIGAGAPGVDYTLTFDGDTKDGVLTWMEDEDYFKFSDDILMESGERLYFRDTSSSIYNDNSYLWMTSNHPLWFEVGGQDVALFQSTKALFAQNVEIGVGAAGVDYTLTFNGETNDGVITWMEDEDYFKFSDDILMDSTEKVQFRDTALYISSKNDGYLDFDADTGFRFNTGNIGIGVSDPDTKLEVYGTSTQLKLSYDGSKYATFTINPSGKLIIDSSDQEIIINDRVYASGELVVGDDINYTQFNSSGFMTAYEDARFWDDLRFPLTRDKQGQSDKPEYDFDNIGLLFPQNDPAEIAYITAQMSHAWDITTSLKPHIHYIQSQDVSPVFKVDYRWYDNGCLPPESWTTISGYVSQFPYVGSGELQIENFEEMDPSAQNPPISGMSSFIDIKLYRDDNEYVGDCLVKEFDIHYRMNTFGSQFEYIK